jgi:hypothetical protein
MTDEIKFQVSSFKSQEKWFLKSLMDDKISFCEVDFLLDLGGGCVL